jgi:carbon storage regulator
MLILTRRVGESIAIGEHVVVKVLDVQGQKVQLGVDAPKDVKVVRPETQEPGTGSPLKK